MNSQALHVSGMLLPGDRHVDLFIAADGMLSADAVDDALTVARNVFLLPGLVDMHTHLDIKSPAPEGAGPEEKVRASARMELDAGVLALREPGSWSRAAAGILPSEGLPTVITAGRFLAPPAGYVPGLPHEVVAAGLVAAALDELAHSNGWVKVIGDWSDGRGGWQLNYPAEVLAAMTTAVHAAGGRCAIHAASGQSVAAALDAGFDTIEHGIGATTENIRMMADRQVTWVPTLGILDQVVPLARSRGTCADELAHFKDGVADHMARVGLAIDAGVQVLAGTDAGLVKHGTIASEIRLLARAGMSAERAIASGSWEARAYLGLDGLRPGHPVDLVGYPSDPREDLSVLDRPSLIVLRGRVVHGAATPERAL